MIALFAQLNGCITTRHTFKGGQKVPIHENGTLIVLPIKGNLEKDMSGVYRKLTDDLTTECQRAYSIWELDYDLRVSGIDPEKIIQLDSTELIKLQKWNKNFHLIEFENINNTKVGHQGRSKIDLRYPTETLPPVRRTIWVTTVYDSEPSYYWQFQTYVDAGGIEKKGRGYNPYKTAYFIGLKKSIKYFKKGLYTKCN